MPQYTSHIYIKPTKDLLAFLQSHSLLSRGLFYIRQPIAIDEKQFARNGFPDEGLIVIREVCDPTKPRDSHDEAQIHENHGAPVLPWWDLQGPADVQVIPPNIIPTLAFGQIHENHPTNLPPPIEFIRFLKNLSATYKTTVAFYHYYTAYADKLADNEYAWVFGKRDSVLIRHVGKPYQAILYTAENEPQVVYDKSAGDQPILFSVMQEFDITISASFYETYFYNFNWNNYKV
jgi:hypothetical protein